MKNLRFSFLVGTILLYLSACSNEDTATVNEAKKTMPVAFELSTDAFNPMIGSKAITPSYTGDGLRVFAYKLGDNGADYEYAQLLSLTNLTFSAQTKKWVGKALLEPGTYRFIPTYGLDVNRNISLSSLPGSQLTNELGISHVTTGVYGNTLPEIFLPIRPVDQFRSYTFDLTGEPTETVRDTISRAVSRVDVMFIKATKIDSLTYIEETYPTGQDVFGTLGLGKMELRFTNLNQRMNFFGVKQDGTFSATINVQDLGMNGDGVTIGSRPTASIVGGDDYFRFDSIQTNDIINGSAHVFGTYLLPNNDETRTAGLQLYVEPFNRIANSRSRTIDISLGDERLIPLEQNKVTLIKIYVLRDHLFGVDPDPEEPDDPDPVPPEPPVPPVPATDFAVEIEVIVMDWDESNYVNQPVTQ